MKIKNELIKMHDSDVPVDGRFVIPDGVTEIGKYAFGGCSSLKEIVIPDSVTEIGDSAFGGCSSLKEIVIPDSVTEIGDSAFWGCKSLEEIVIPDSVTQIVYSAFWGCSSLKEIVIPSSVTKIGDFAFWGCSSLKEIVIPDSVTEIGDSAFQECSSLKEIVISDNVTTIRNNILGNCQTLSTLYWKNKKYSVRCIDGYCMHILKEKQWGEYNILKCSYFSSDREDIVYIAQKGEVSAHGNTIREAVSDLQFKLMKDVDISEHITRIAQQGYMNANDYRLLTGACRQGTDYFLREHNLTWEDVMTVEEVLKLTKGFYGFESFQKAAERILSIEN